MLSFIRSLKSMLRSANAVAVITFPPSLLSPSFCKRWQHMADVLLSVRAIPDEDKELGKLPTGYQDVVGFLNVHKIACVNTQVPVILEATTFSIKLQKRRFLVLECLNQAPIDGSSGTSYGTSGGCSVSSKSGAPRFLASLHIDHQASACQTNTENSPGTEQKHCWSLQAEHSRVFIINWPSSAIVEYAVVDNNPALDARKRASLC